MSEPLAIEERDGVAVLRMQFGRANALNPEVVAHLRAGFDQASPLPTVLTGEGSIFCAGLDLVSLDRMTREEMEAFVERFSALMVQVLTARQPVIAAVNGHAVAGGCVLALACDQRVGTAGDFKIGMNELAIGLTLPAVALEIPRGVLTPAALRKVVLAAELVDPQRARSLGLLDEVADDAETAVDRACEIARHLGREPEAFAHVKGSVVLPIADGIRELRAALDYRFVDTWFSAAATVTRQAAVARLTQKKDQKPTP